MDTHRALLISVLALTITACKDGDTTNTTDTTDTTDSIEQSTSNPPVISLEPSVKIDMNNAKAVTAETNMAMTLLAALSNGFNIGYKALLRDQAPPGQSTRACTGGGTENIQFDDKNNTGKLDTGDGLFLEAKDCIVNGTKNNGARTLTNLTVEGDPNKQFSTYTLAGSASTAAFSSDNSIAQINTILNGQTIFRFEGTSTADTLRVEYPLFDLTQNGRTNTFSNFIFEESYDLSKNAFTRRMTGNIKTTSGNIINVATISDLQGADDGEPTQGELRIDGFQSSVSLVPLADGTNVKLNVDTNGDGNTDGVVNTTWLELIGEKPGEESAGNQSDIALTTANFSEVEDSQGNLRLFGEVTNNGNVTVTFPRITCSFYDSASKFMGEDIAYAIGSTVRLDSNNFSTNAALKPAETGVFHFWTDLKKSSVARYNCITAYTVSKVSEPSAKLEISGQVNARKSIIDTLELDGQVKNSGTRGLTFGNVYFVIRNNNNSIVDISSAPIKGETVTATDPITKLSKVIDSALSVGATGTFSKMTTTPYDISGTYESKFDWEDADIQDGVAKGLNSLVINPPPDVLDEREQHHLRNQKIEQLRKIIEN